MKPNLPSSVLSLQDLKSIIVDIRKYSEWFSLNAVKTKVAGSPYAEQPAISPAAITYVEQLAAKAPLSVASLDGLIKELEKLGATLPSITITLAAPAPGSLKITLVNWCRQNIDPNILVDFRFNSTILGGMVLQYGSHIYDWSFRRQILTARQHFPEVLRRV